MLAHFAQDVTYDAEVELRPPEEYVLNITQVALTPKALGIGSGKGMKKEIEPTILQVSSKDINGEDVISTICTLDHTCRQATVNLTFGWDESIRFSLAKGGGKGPISLTGLLQPSPDEEDEFGGPRQSGEMSSSDEDDDEEDDDEDMDPRVFGMNGEEEESDDSEDEEEDDSEDDEAPQLDSASSKRKRSFDLDSDAVEARSHNPNVDAKKSKTAVAKAPLEAADGSDSEEDSSDEEEANMDGESVAFMKMRLEQFANEEDHSRILSELDRMPPLHTKKGVKEEEEEEDEEDDESEEEEEEDDESEDESEEDDEEDDADMSPEDVYEQSIIKALKEKGGEAVLSSLGNVPKPQGLPKPTKLSQFLKGRKGFTVNGGKVTLN